MQSPVDSRRVEQSAEAARPVGKRSAAGRGASVSSIPVGNHGDNLQPVSRLVIERDEFDHRFQFMAINPCGDWRCVHGRIAVYNMSQADADRRNA